MLALSLALVFFLGTACHSLVHTCCMHMFCIILLPRDANATAKTPSIRHVFFFWIVHALVFTSYSRIYSTAACIIMQIIICIAINLLLIFLLLSTFIIRPTIALRLSTICCVSVWQSPMILLYSMCTSKMLIAHPKIKVKKKTNPLARSNEQQSHQ